MNRILLILGVLITVTVSVFAQSTPCTVKYPIALDDLDSLCRAKDNPQGTLAFTINASATTFSTTVSAAAFPTSGLSLKIDDEVILCTTRSGSTFSGCTRGQDGSSATPHVAGSAVRMPILSLHHNTQNNAILGVKTKVGVGSSTAGAANTDDVLKKNSDGTTSWRPEAITVGAGGVSNPGMTIIEADNDSSGDEVVSLRTRGVERAGFSSTASVLSNFQDKGGQLFNVKAYGAVCNGSTSDTAAISSAVTAAAAVNGAIYLPPSASGCVVGTATISVPVVTDGGSLKLTTGQTTTFTSTLPNVSIFWLRNALAGQGTASFAGNRKVNTIYAEWWGAVADDSTDCFAPLQAAATALKSLTSGVLRLNAGTYRTSAAVQFTQIKGIQLIGSGRDNTTIKGTGGTTAIQFNGAWRSRIEGITFTTSVSISGAGVFELDGNYDGTNTQSVQGNTFIDCYFVGNQLAPYAFALTRRGGSSGQGSENLFLNCNFDSGTAASYYQNGFNALSNTIIGGNFQGHSKYGIQLVAGSLNIFGTAFQSTYGYVQIANGGFDIEASSAGTFDAVTVDGVRTESLAFYNGNVAQRAVIRGLSQTPSVQTWAATTVYTLNQSVIKQNPTGTNKLYRVTTAGTSGGSQPTWPASGTVTDGTVVWTMTDFTAIVGRGWVENTANFTVGNVLINNGEVAEVQASFTLDASTNFQSGTGINYRVILVDATGGNRTITLPDAVNYIGRIITIKKYDTSINTVTVTASGNAIDGTGNQVIPGGSRGYVTLFASGGFLTQAWYVMGKSF